MSQDQAWWRTAVIYEVYPRSFADGSGDGVGDLAGVRSRLDYLAELGVDALWFTPWFSSPMADGGYDVADYRQIDPVFGSLGDAEQLIAEAHERDLRVIIDIVPNHCSDRHAWFVEALAAAPGSAARRRFHFRPGRGQQGELPPNNWPSIFGGPAWTRITEADGSPGEWYLHLFAPEQPDLDWACPEVNDEFDAVLRFWFDRGVDGVRVDSAALLVKDPALPDLVEDGNGPPAGPHPFVDLDAVHDVYRRWRQVADSYPGSRALIGEVWLEDRDRFLRYLRPGELHSAFNFDFLRCPLDAGALRKVIEDTLSTLASVGAAPTWVLSNHDVVRPVTRYGRRSTDFQMSDRRLGEPTDLDLGTRRARAAVLMLCSLPGSAYLYQGEELGLFEVEDLPDDLRQDPIWARSGHADRGRDGCRVPLPWSGRKPPFGFSDRPGQPWLPQPDTFARLSVDAEASDPASMLELYREALRLRRAEPDLAGGALCLLDAPPGVLAYRRGGSLIVVVNLSPSPVPLPGPGKPLLATGPLAEGMLAPDSALWWRSDEPEPG